MSERKLAHIERVVSVEPIPNADNLELVTVLGWKCVCRKGEIQKDSFVCYIEVDSIVPTIPYFSFMEQRKYRVKTIKLRGQISQGLVVPILDCCGITQSKEWLEFKEGRDVTKELGITKWLSPSEREADYQGTPKKKHNWFVKYMTRYDWFRKLFKKKSKSFPEWIAKTDEERIQNIPWVLKNKAPMVVTEKLDGQSTTYWIKKKLFNYEYGICSRSVRKFERDNSNWSRAFKQLDIKKKLKQLRDYLGNDVAIQGELIGPNIQGNHYNLKEYKLFLFNMFNIKEKKYYEYHEAKSNAVQVSLEFVPHISGEFILPDTVDELIKYSNGNSKLYNTYREGLVFRTPDKSISFKCVSPVYLLKEKE